MSTLSDRHRRKHSLLRETDVGARLLDTSQPRHDTLLPPHNISSCNLPPPRITSSGAPQTPQTEKRVSDGKAYGGCAASGKKLPAGSYRADGGGGAGAQWCGRRERKKLLCFSPSHLLALADLPANNVGYLELYEGRARLGSGSLGKEGLPGACCKSRGGHCGGGGGTHACCERSISSISRL